MDELTEFWTAEVSYGDRDPYGNIKTETTSPAWIEHGERLVRDTTGNEILATATVIMPAGTPVRPDQHMRLPGEERARRVVAVARYLIGDLDLPDHVEAAIE